MSNYPKPLLINGSLALLVWSGWYLLGGETAIRAMYENWPVTLTMVFGSFIAGATSEGGGAVAFPVFTKLLEIAPADARVFSLAIQSVGMTSASITILLLRIPVSWKALTWSGLAGVPGIVISTLWLAPVVPPVIVRISFTLLLTSFAITLWLINRDVHRYTHSDIPLKGARERFLLVLFGFIGGMMSGLVGNGIDIMTFALMVLLFRVSEKIATPTSVLLMASNSIVGFAMHGLILDTFTPEIRGWWLAAVPVVCVGAPLGALVCNWMTRHHIARVLIVLILIELITSLTLIPMTPVLILWSACILIVLAVINQRLYVSRRYLQ